MSTDGYQVASTEKDVVFGQGGGRDLRCDIYRPLAGTDKRTALIHLHGGGFRRGSKEMVADKAPYFSSRGHLCIAAEYRLAAEAKWPAQIEDVKACIRWARANADYLGIDPAKIGVVGYSAGAHLALVAAGTANRPEFEGHGGNPGVGTELAACFPYYPPIEVHRQADGSEHVLMAPGSSEDDYRNASPISYAAPGFPPTALFHGTADVTVPLAASQRMFEALRAENVPVELHIMEGVPHAFDRHSEFADSCAALCDLFLERHVVNPRVYPPFQPTVVA